MDELEIAKEHQMILDLAKSNKKRKLRKAKE